MNNSSEPCILDDELKVLGQNLQIRNVSRNVSRETSKSLFFVLLSIHIYYFTPIISLHPPIIPVIFLTISQSLRRRKLFY